MSRQSDASLLEIPAADDAERERRAVERESRAAGEGGSRWRTWYWLAIPVAAIAAYALVVRTGFLADDFILIERASQPGADWRALLPGSAWFYYRPVGVLLTWELGWELWGYNPVPYHVIQLLLHAGTALVLGLWLASATGSRALDGLWVCSSRCIPCSGKLSGGWPRNGT